MFIVSLARRNHTVLADTARAAHVMLMVRAVHFSRKGRFTMPKTQRPATWCESPRQLSIHNVHVLATSRPPRPWYLHDMAGRKSPSTKMKEVPARQLWVLEPENFPPSLGASQGKRLWCCLCFQDYRFAFSAKDWSYCQNLKQIYLRKPP